MYKKITEKYTIHSNLQNFRLHAVKRDQFIILNSLLYFSSSISHSLGSAGLFIEAIFFLVNIDGRNI